MVEKWVFVMFSVVLSCENYLELVDIFVWCLGFIFEYNKERFFFKDKSFIF